MGYFDAEPTFKQSYAPQSGAIFGILKQMKETFETNLSNSQKEEMEAQKAYEDLKAAKEAEIKAGTELKDTKTQEELAEFNAEEKDVLQSIGALKSAIIVLSKHHEFLQTVPSEQLINIAAMLQWQFHKHKDMLA